MDKRNEKTKEKEETLLNEQESILSDFNTYQVGSYTLDSNNSTARQIGSLEAILEDGHHYHYLDDSENDFSECLEILEIDLLKELGYVEYSDSRK